MFIALLGTACLALVVLSTVQLRMIRKLRHDKLAFLSFAENSPDLIFRYDRQGRRLYVNPAVAKLFGKPVEEIVGKSPGDSPFLDSEQNRKLVDGTQRVFETRKKDRIEVSFTDLDGHTRNHFMLLIPECDAEGQVNTVLGLSRDITAIREAERTVSNLVAQLPGFVCKFRMSTDGHMSYPFASPRIEEFFGLRPEDIKDDATPLHAMTHPEDAPRVLQTIVESARTLSRSSVEYRLLRPGYPERWMEVIANPEQEADGGVLWYAIFLDISERKRAEQDLKQALESIDGIVNAIPDLLFEADLNGTYLNVWASDQTLLAAQKEALLGNTIRDVLLPDAADIAMSAIEEADRTGASFGKVIRIELPHGDSWFELSVSRKSGPSQTDRRFIALSRDVTERKRLQDELADSHHFLDGIIDAVADPIFVKDRQHRWILLNQAACRLIGGTREELIGKSDFDFFPEHEARAFWEGDEVVFTDGKEFAAEEEITNKQGEQRNIFTRKTTFTDSHGNPILVGVTSDFTERRRMEDELADSQNFLDGIIDAVADPIFVKDRQHRWIHVNEAFCRLVGATREELIGKSDFDFFPEQEARSFWQGDDVVFTSGKEFASEDEIDGNQPGEKRYTFARKTMFIDVHGSPILVGVISDVTERKRLQEEVAESQNFLDRIINATIDPIFVKDRQHRWILVNDAFCHLLGDTREELIGKSDFDYFPEDEAHLFWEGDELVFTEGKDFSREEEITIKGGEKRCIFTRKRMFNDVHGKPNLTAVITDITERKRMELQLAARERELRTLMENTPDNIVRYTPNARYLYANPVLERTTGKHYEQLQGKTIMECFPDGRYAEIERRVIATAANGCYDEMVMEVPVADGDIEYHLIRFIPERDDKGAVVSVLIIGTDITERKRIELQLAARERELRSLMENIPANIARYTPDARNIYVNPPLERITKTPRGEFLDRTPMETFPDGYYNEYQQQILDTAASGVDTEMEITVPIADGEVEVHLLKFVAERDEKGAVVSVLTIGTDITERKRAELALAARERELRTLMENIPDNIARYTPDARHVYMSPVLERFNDKPKEYFLGRTPMECFPDGRFSEYERRVVATAASGSFDEMEMVVPMADGEVGYHMIRFIPERDDKGAVVSVLVIGTDITERKRAEEKLRLAASVFTNTNEGIIVTDVDNRILDVNAAFTRITGYTREEVIGRDPKLLRSQRQTSEFYTELWLTLEQMGHWAGEIWNLRKNGEEYAEWLTISVVKDEQGKLSHYVAVFSDITLIKEHQEQLQHIAHHDALTGLPNRLLFMDRLKQAVAQARRTDGLLAVCYGDLDGFKPVNDRFGHEAGDAVLTTIAQRMQECVRELDTVGRIGGDEFVLLLQNLESDQECKMILERLLGAIAQPIRLDGHEVSVTASLGIALFPQDDVEPDTLLRHADQAMYEAKRAGKSIYRLFDPSQAHPDMGAV